MRKARREGKFDEAIKEIDGRKVEITDETVVVEATEDRAALVHLCGDRPRHHVGRRRGAPQGGPEGHDRRVVRDAPRRGPPPHGPQLLLHRQGGEPDYEEAHGHDGAALPELHPRRVVVVAALTFRPKIGIKQMSLTEVLQKYVKTDAESVKEAWAAEYACKDCSHGPKCKNKATCEWASASSTCTSSRAACSTRCARPRASSRKFATSGHCNVCRAVEKKDDEPTADGRSVLGLQIVNAYVDDVLDGVPTRTSRTEKKSSSPLPHATA